MPYRQTERSRRHNAAVRDRIVAAARRLFAEEGYTGTTIRRVAESAGTSTGNVYFHIGGKDALLEAVARTFVGEAAVIIDSIAEEAEEAVEKMATLVYAGAREFYRRSNEARVVMKNLDRRVVREAVYTVFVERTEAFFAGAYAAGILDGLSGDAALAGVAGRAPEDAHAMALAWQGAIFWVLEDILDHRGESGRRDGDAAASFLVGWNLRALGLPDERVAPALRAARRRYQAKRR